MCRGFKSLLRYLSYPRAWIEFLPRVSAKEATRAPATKLREIPDMVKPLRVGSDQGWANDQVRDDSITRYARRSGRDRSAREPRSLLQNTLGAEKFLAVFGHEALKREHALLR